MTFQWQGRGKQIPPDPEQGDRWLFLVPHDDDAVIGAGLAIQSALASGVEVTIAVTTNGSLGYCDLDERDTITAIRKEETLQALSLLGLADPGSIRFFDFGDGDLFVHQGRRINPGRIYPDGGLQESFTRLFRQTKPDVLFLCSSSDLHPDHRIVYSEAIISVFHAAGEIWPELGTPINTLPRILEFPVYCALERDPDLRLTGDSEVFNRKLDAIAAFRSQKQIGALVDRVRRGGSAEYFRHVRFDLYEPHRYHSLFEASEHAP